MATSPTATVAVGPSPPIAERVGAHVKRLEHAFMARKAEALRPLGLSVPQYSVLGYLLGSDHGKSATQLGREALVTSQTITGIVANLEAKGLVRRLPSPVHQRVMLVSLTDEGEALARAADARAGAIEQAMRDAMSDAEFATLTELLERAAAAIEPAADYS